MNSQPFVYNSEALEYSFERCKWIITVFSEHYGQIDVFERFTSKE